MKATNLTSHSLISHLLRLHLNSGSASSLSSRFGRIRFAMAMTLVAQIDEPSFSSPPGTRDIASIKRKRSTKAQKFEQVDDNRSSRSRRSLVSEFNKHSLEEEQSCVYRQSFKNHSQEEEEVGCIYGRPDDSGCLPERVGKGNVAREHGEGNVAREHGDWRSLRVEPSELCLALTLPTGQSFRWKPTGPSEFTGVVDRHLVSLRQVKNDVQFFLHQNEMGSSHEEAEKALRDYLNLNTSLKDIWAPFVAADARFAALAPHMAGARLLRQHPLECVFQFICSSNNHIQRISQMVDYLGSLGPYLGTVKGFSFHTFPSLDHLACVTEAQLRNAGFGYRAKYIVGAVEELHAKKGGGEQWLLSLRNFSLEDALEALCSLPGIGPKVAACVALFSLDQHHAIPVDTHVWQIATTYITPELSGERLTPKLHTAVSEAFVKRFGKYAGWAQNVLFISELSSHQILLPEHLRSEKAMKVKGKGRKKAKVVES